ncbi:snare-like protein [Multifurca ochricompacta]|uniref:Trafficking protein particle complex subunit n=1 Tax=Multifurca ochricompacta TaxID=376703 RepID=A0AAD4QKX5_9AGAM|nr:snare-like protein [Multifurca ochricompacta]
MTIYCLYIFDRHCNCVYYHDWHRTKRPRRADEGGGLLLGVSHAISPLPSSAPNSTPETPFTSPRNTLSTGSGVLVAYSGDSIQSQQSTAQSALPLLQTQGAGAPSVVTPSTSSPGLPFDEEAKLVYGRLSGRDESFVSYRTSTYKLHLFETVSGYRFVMLSDPNAESLRFVMRSIYTGPFLEYVVRNPLALMDSRERGIDNEYFRASVDRLIRGLSVFQ